MFAFLAMLGFLACGPAAQSPLSEPAGIHNPALVSDHEPTPITASLPQQADPQDPVLSKPTPTPPDPTSIPSDPTPPPSEPTPTPTKGPPNIDYGDPCYPAGGNLFTGNEEYPGPEDIEQFMNCYEEMLQYRFGWPHDDILPPIWKAWPTLREAIADNAVVASAHAKVISCLADKGHTAVPDRLLFYWQGFADPELYETFLGSLSNSEVTQMNRLHTPSQECGVQEGFFTAQETAMIAELERLQTADPERISSLQQWGLLDSLKKPGIILPLYGDQP